MYHNQRKTERTWLIGNMNRKPRAIDLYAGLGGWTEGLLAEGYAVVGFDIEEHVSGISSRKYLAGNQNPW